MRQACIALVLLLVSSAAVAQIKPQQQNQVVHPVAAIPIVQKWQLVADPNEGSFQLEMPVGWRVGLGSKRRSALQYRPWATAISPDGLTVIAMNDPDEPSYATPMHGFPPGSVYNASGTVYRVAPYHSAAQYAMTWGARKLPAFCTAIKVTNNRPRPDAAQRLNPLSAAMGIRRDYGEATFSCDKSGIPVTAYVFIGSTAIPTGPGTGLWYADVIYAFLAPTPVAGVAASTLAHMIKSSRPNLQWVARQSKTNMDVSRIATQTNNAISDMVMQGWQERGAINDRVMAEGERTRLGVDVYADPATGTQYEVFNKNQYYWANAAGTVVGTDTDTAPSSSFSRLNRVPPK